MAMSVYGVAGKSKETADTWTLRLLPERSRGAFTFDPGQFNMLYAFGVGEVPISLSGNPTHADGLVHTIRNVGPVTAAICRLRKGDCLGLRGPFGNPWPVQSAVGSDVAIIAGGLGLAPLRPALYHVLANRERYGRVVLIYGSRSPSDMLYRKELAAWRSRFDFDVYVTVDRATPAWRGNVGTVVQMIGRAGLDAQTTVALLCGPEVMMRFASVELLGRGFDPSRIFFSMERNMKCAMGLCGHCQYGPSFVCKDGPVFRYDEVSSLLGIRGV